MPFEINTTAISPTSATMLVGLPNGLSSTQPVPVLLDGIGGIPPPARGYFLPLHLTALNTNLPATDGAWTGTATAGAYSLTITGGTLVALAGTATWLAVEDYGNRYYFNVVLAVSGSTFTLARPLSQSGSVTLRKGLDTTSGQHLSTYGSYAFADAIYDADPRRAVFDRTSYRQLANDNMTTAAYTAGNMPVEGWIPYGGLPVNQISYNTNLNQANATSGVWHSQTLRAVAATVQSAGQGLYFKLNRAVAGTLAFTIGLATPDANATAQCVIVVDGVTFKTIALSSQLSEVRQLVKCATSLEVQVTCTSMATATAGQIQLRCGDTSVYDDAGTLVSRLIPRKGKTALLGDSWMDPLQATTFVASRLNARLAADAYTGSVVSFAKSGSTIAFARSVLPWVLANAKPDCVVVNQIINDQNYVNATPAANSGWPRDILPAQHPDGVTTILDGGHVPSMAVWSQYVDDCAAMCAAAGVQFVYVGIPCTGSQSQTQTLIPQIAGRVVPNNVGRDREQATTHELGLATGAINVRGKFAGRTIRNSTTGALLVAAGPATTDTWKDTAGTTVITPA